MLKSLHCIIAGLADTTSYISTEEELQLEHYEDYVQKQACAIQLH